MGESQVLKHSHTHSSGGGFKYGIIHTLINWKHNQIGDEAFKLLHELSSGFKEKLSYLQRFHMDLVMAYQHRWFR